MKSLKSKLEVIHIELCKYSERVFTDMTPQKYFIVAVKYGVILRAIADFHQGKAKIQQEAIEYLKSAQYEKDCRDVGIDKDAMDRIVYNPQDYIEEIGYKEPETPDEEDYYFPFDGE